MREEIDDEVRSASEFKFLDPGPPIDELLLELAAELKDKASCAAHLDDLNPHPPDGAIFCGARAAI